MTGTVPRLDRVDFLVVGSGVAGLSAAVRAAEVHGMTVGVLTKGELQQSTTRWAQGGVAAVLGGDPDSTDLHLADTLAAGAGLCDEDAVRVLVDEGPRRVNELITMGAMFDRDERGVLELAREGGHSLPRVVHAGGVATGAEIERALIEAVRRTATVIRERSFALDLVIENGRCAGVIALDESGERFEVPADNVLLAAGGAGQLFAVTTNPLVATGDGVAMAMRANAVVADVEFVQFHPTALHMPSMPRPLLSEALRGHGALLRDTTGERFVDELLPRDEVSRAMTRRMLDLDVDHLWLDTTGLDGFAQRFPTTWTELIELGLDPTSEWIPVAPAAHYLCGGVVADLDGATSIPGLWAAGEVACSGVHGANRLASNSLLEGMVFGFRVVEAVEAGKTEAESTGAMRTVLGGGDNGGIGGVKVVEAPEGRRPNGDGIAIADALTRVQQTMTNDAGVLRSRESLERAATTLVQLEAGVPTDSDKQDVAELTNLVTVGKAVVALALARHESRGAHTRSDYPDRDDDQFRNRLLVGG